MPNLHVWRPADTIETTIAWKSAIESKTTPTLLSLSRQALPQAVMKPSQIQDIQKGGYLLQKKKNAIITLIATGSEVSIMLEASDQLLKTHNIHANVVSMPCVEV